MEVTVRRTISRPASLDRVRQAVVEALAAKGASRPSIAEHAIDIRSHIVMAPGSWPIQLEHIRIQCACPQGVTEVNASAVVPVLSNLALPTAIIVPFTVIAAFAISPFALVLGVALLVGAAAASRIGAKIWLEEVLGASDQRLSGQSRMHGPVN